MNNHESLPETFSKSELWIPELFFWVPGKVEVDIQLLLQLQEQLITSANAIAAQLEEPEASRVEGIWILQNEANMLMILQIMRISLNGWMLSWNLIMEWIYWKWTKWMKCTLWFRAFFVLWGHRRCCESSKYTSTPLSSETFFDCITAWRWYAR